MNVSRNSRFFSALLGSESNNALNGARQMNVYPGWPGGLVSSSGVGLPLGWGKVNPDNLQQKRAKCVCNKVGEKCGMVTQT